MRQENLTAVDTYLDSLGTARTTRHASEELYICPALPDAVDAERYLRATLHTVYDGHVVVGEPEVVEPLAESDLPSIKSGYWDLAQQVTPAHGAKAGFSLEDYLHVGQDRHYDAIRAAVMADYPADSVPVLMFDCIESYSNELSIDVMSSSRILTTLFSTCLPAVKRSAAGFRMEGYDDATASNMAITEFTASMVPDHITDLKKRASEGLIVKNAINKSSLYPDMSGVESEDTPLRLTTRDAEGLAKAYRVQERPYTPEELAMGEKIAQDPSMQRALLLFHNSLVEYSAAYLARHPERREHSMEPFSEVFVPIYGDDGEMTLAPNPKLLKVVMNNTIPAIANILLEQGGTLSDLNGNHVQQGIELAKRLRVFSAQIGKFNSYDEGTDTVELSTFFLRTCPASQMFSEALTRRLPDLYDASKQALS